MTRSRTILLLGSVCTLALAGACSDDTTGTTETGTSTETGDGDGDPTGDGDGDPATGDGDGDPTTGDGDGDPTTGDGDGDDPAECGNGIVEGAEECDDGNAVDTDACTSACLNNVCGDGYVNEGVEECDDGNPNDNDACTAACVNNVCGDGFVNEGVEGCDDGNNEDGDGCTAACVLETCGDGVVQGLEGCDDGNDIDTDDCTNMCIAAGCGDSIVWEGNEDCDDGNDVDTDDCIACVAATCGDSIVWEGNEDCDDGNDVDTDACVTCTDAVCGDGFVQDGIEDCDDGNNDPDDGCAPDCTLEVLTGTTCLDILGQDPQAPSGLYMVDPDGNGGVDPFEAFCDMETDGGGWTLILNRLTDSDNTGQPDLDSTMGVPDAPRATNWQFNIDLFWTDASEVAFADKENADCQDCTIGDYDSAIKVDRPNAGAWSRTCGGNSVQVNYTKLVGPAPNGDSAYQCAATLGWGSCGGNVCHYGTHWQTTSSDGSWSQNQQTEMHFPSAYSSYRSYGNVNNPPSAWCRSCGGGLAGVLNQSTTCCNVANQFNARSRWTIWVR